MMQAAFVSLQTIFIAMRIGLIVLRIEFIALQDSLLLLLINFITNEELFIAEYDYELAEGTILNPKWLYIYRAHGVAGLIIRWIEEDFSEEPEYMSKQIIELMVTSTSGFHVK